MAEKNIKSGLLAAVALLAEQGNSATLEKFAVAVVAETIFFNDWSSIDKGAEISAFTDGEIRLKNIVKFIRSKCEDQRQYRTLKEYNRESLYLLIENEWGEFGYEQCLIPLKWAYEYDKQNGLVNFDGFVEKKRSEEKNGKEYKIDVPSCGDRGYSVVNDGNVVAVEQMVQQINNISTTTKAGEVKVKLDSIYKKLVEKRGGDNCINNFEYIWQWKITTKEYDEIKKLLESDDCKSCISSIYKNNVNYCFIIVAYVAERYKREWNGNDRNDNALELIGLGDNNKSKEIAEKYFGKNNPKVYRHSSSSTNEWLDSLRMEGGLPINYINKASEGDRTQNNLVRFTEYLYEDAKKSIGILTEKTNETTRHSYEKGYSLKKYIDTLLEGGLESVCCVDLDSDMFNKFKELLENGRDNARRNSKKFAYKYRIWKWDSQKEFLLHQSIVLKQDSAFGETQELISRERIKQWDSKLEENDVFWLEIGGVRYEFHPWKKEFYRSVNGFTEFPLPTTKFPNCNLVLDPIYFVNQKGEKKKIDSIVEDNKSYIKFTSDNSYDWVTGKSGELSAVLLRRRAKIELEHSEEICNVGNSLRWVEFSDRIKIGGKYVYSGKFDVHPKDEAIHPIAKYKYIRSISYRKDDEDSFIYLLNSSKIKSENFVLVREDEKETKIESGKVKYWDKETSQWKECDENLSGLVELDIDGQRINAYVLPDNAEITRNTGEEKIIFKNIDIGVVDGYEITTHDNTWQINDNYAEGNQYRDSIIVDVKVADNEYISFDIVRPLRRSDKKFNGRIMSSDQNVPKNLQSQYTLRIFDENGVRYIEDREAECLYSNNKIRYNNQQEFYYIAEGANPTIEDNLEFVFILNEGYREIDLTISEKTITESGKDKKYICLENVPTEKGVIIQTLRNKMPEMTYYEPLWCGGSNKFVFAQENSHNKTSLDRLKLSVKHKLYFKELMYCGVNEERYEITPKLLVDFFEDYCKNHNEYDWNALWDMVFELDKDWMSIPRGVWCEFATDDEKKKLVCDLFKNRPNTDSEVFDRFVDNYWSLEWNPKKGRSNNAYKFLKTILDSGDFYNLPDMDKDFNEELDRLLNN
ncbi:MAG: hypothetical protein IKY27_02290 [Bacteroidales bacterium]|nr:hypothetical protein [Bacteroidales bacterium]